jgi:hypothetical protein
MRLLIQPDDEQGPIRQAVSSGRTFCLARISVALQISMLRFTMKDGR